MKRKTAKVERKPSASPRPRSKSVRAPLAKDQRTRCQNLESAGALRRHAACRRGRRSPAQLEATRARILDLEARVEIDPLTETLNRRGFERELKRSLAYVKRYGTRAALVYIDLDEFKPVNDRHGHAAGDAVLKAIAAALVGHVRASDVVARIGGDEFVALLWNVSGPAAAAKAAALEKAVYQLLFVGAVPRSSSARPQALRCLARSTPPTRCCRGPTRPCIHGSIHARRNGSSAG